jgi:ATP-dependent Lhr-like helicase
MHVADMLNPEIQNAFFSRFPDLTDSQKESIPPILRGEDTLIISGTGSGKTEGVLAPLISLNFESARSSNHVQIVYVAPTKALVNDVAKRISPVLDQLELGVSIRHGDNNQLTLKQRHTLLVTTPESFEVLLATNPAVFQEVKAIVIDEAHLLFNQQRGLQLAIEINRLEKLLERSVQVVASSATVSSPRSVWQFFRPRHEFTLANQPGHREIRSQIRIGYDHADLIKLLERLPNDRPLKILIFGDTKRECDAIALKLQEDKAISADIFSHHASLSPEMRLIVEKNFSEKPNAICVATSTLELGIDIGDINLIILWGKARNWQSFMQRIGRGNRRSKFVEVICILPNEQSNNFTELFGFQSLLNQVELGAFPSQDPFELFGVVCQQICVTVSRKEAGFLPLRFFKEIFQAFEFIDEQSLIELLLHMSELGLLIKEPNRMAFGPSEMIHNLRDKNLLWSNIPHSASSVPLVLGNTVIGNLNSSNLFTLNIGSVFAFAAKRLKVVSLIDGLIKVKETSEVINSKVKFGGFPQSIDVSLLSALWQYLADNRHRVQKDIFPQLRADELSQELDQLFSTYDLHRSIPFFRIGGKFHYITFGGVTLNSALALYVGNVEGGSNDVLLVSKKEIDFNSLPPSLFDYIPVVMNLDLGVGGKTEYQDFLTSDLRALENISRWKSESYHAETLKRLVESTPFEIQAKSSFQWA